MSGADTTLFTSGLTLIALGLTVISGGRREAEFLRRAVSPPAQEREGDKD